MINDHFAMPLAEKYTQDNVQLMEGKVILDFISWDLGWKSNAETSGKMGRAMYNTLSPKISLNTSNANKTQVLLYFNTRAVSQVLPAWSKVRSHGMG